MITESEILDETCQALKGHDNWMLLRTMADEDRAMVLDAMDHGDCDVVVFWKNGGKFNE